MTAVFYVVNVDQYARLTCRACQQSGYVRYEVVIKHDNGWLICSVGFCANCEEAARALAAAVPLAEELDQVL